MIEMRWLERRVTVPPEYNLGYPPKYPTERVLQYREGSYGAGDDCCEPNPEWIWFGSEWCDVSVVKE